MATSPEAPKNPDGRLGALESRADIAAEMIARQPDAVRKLLDISEMDGIKSSLFVALGISNLERAHALINPRNTDFFGRDLRGYAAPVADEPGMWRLIMTYNQPAGDYSGWGFSYETKINIDTNEAWTWPGAPITGPYLGKADFTAPPRLAVGYPGPSTGGIVIRARVGHEAAFAQLHRFGESVDMEQLNEIYRPLSLLGGTALELSQPAALQAT